MNSLDILTKDVFPIPKPVPVPQMPAKGNPTLALQDGMGAYGPFPDLMTEDELVKYLRLPEISASKDFHNVIENLKRMRELPRLALCHKVLYPRKAIQEWVEQETKKAD